MVIEFLNALGGLFETVDPVWRGEQSRPHALNGSSQFSIVKGLFASTTRYQRTIMMKLVTLTIVILGLIAESIVGDNAVLVYYDKESE